MKIKELIAELEQEASQRVDRENTCDRLKAGSDEQEIKGVAVAMFATPEILKKAHEAGANFLIVHEPVYYNHFDSEIPVKIGLEKKALIDKFQLTIYRFHDHPHYTEPDLINTGMLKDINLPGTLVPKEKPAPSRYILDTPITAKNLAAYLEKRLDIRHIKIAGCPDKEGKILSLSFGAPGAPRPEELEEVDFILTGEVSEWSTAEIARDYAQLGYNKAILVMGHIGSERNGMALIAKRLQESHPELPITYLECGEVYSYTD